MSGPSAKSSAPVALIGYRGTGKTTVARLLAKLWSFDWVDSDVEVELAVGKSIATIFAEDGETAFRDLEAKVVDQLCDRWNTVLALGGGAALRESTQERLRVCRAVVWLKASAATIADRLAGDESTPQRRPNLTNHGGRQEIEQLLAQREPIYRACAALEVDTEGKGPAEVAAEIAAALS